MLLLLQEVPQGTVLEKDGVLSLDARREQVLSIRPPVGLPFDRLFLWQWEERAEMHLSLMDVEERAPVQPEHRQNGSWSICDQTKITLTFFSCAV